MRFTSIVLLIGWLAVASPTMAGLVASSFAFGSGLISIDENSGSTATIGPPIAPMNGMSANSDGQLFGGTTANFQWEFYEINPTNGAATMVNAIMPSSEDFGGIRALEISPTGEVFFVTRVTDLFDTYHQLWSMSSILSDTATLLVDDFQQTQSLAVGPDGTLYGYAFSDAVGLFTIDSSSGAVTSIGGGGVDPQGLAFDADGTLFAVSTDNLHVIDVLTGEVLTQFREGTLEDFRSLAYIPTPSSIAIFAIAAVITRRRRRCR